MDLFQVYDESEGNFRKKEIEDLHARLNEITFHALVPDAIKNHFITTKHLLLYSWFVYRFIPVAEFHAMSSLEYALKIKTGKKKWGLKKLISHAVKNGWVKDHDFEIHRQAQERKKAHTEMIKESFNIDYGDEIEAEEGQYTAILIQSIPYLRNVYAHGSNTIAPQGYRTLKICAEFINKIFEKKA